MHIEHVKIPHVGEGVKSVQIIRYMKSVGDWIDEDGDLLEIETDKATFEIPAMTSGKVSKILYKPGDVVAVGDTVLEISKETADLIKPIGFNQKRRSEITRPSFEIIKAPLHESIFPENQRSLARALNTSADIVISATVEKVLDLMYLEEIRLAFRKISPESTPSKLSILAYACAHAMFAADKFRSQLSKDLTLKKHEACTIGIAIAQKDGSLNVPTMSFALRPNLQDVSVRLKTLLENKEPSSSGYHSLAISDMSSLSIHRANPVVVHPAIATLFIGASYYGFSSKQEPCTLSNLCLTFDHRLINGACAAEFLNSLDKNIKKLHKNIMRGDYDEPSSKH